MQSLVIDKFPIGVGSIGPVLDDVQQAEWADTLAGELLTERFYALADGELLLSCIDERLRKFIRALAGMSLVPNAAGATMTLTVADILIGGVITGKDGSLFDRHMRMIAHLQAKGLLVGVHLDEHDHAIDGGSGCGACDKLSVIFAYMVERLDELFAVIESLGIEVSDGVRSLIRDSLMSLPEFAKGAVLLEAMRALPDGTVLIEQMLGSHDGLAAAINFVEGTTLDRQKLFDEMGLTAFNIDAWAFAPSARLVYGTNADPQQIEAAVIAMVVYNLATSAVLCNSEIRIAVRR